VNNLVVIFLFKWSFVLVFEVVVPRNLALIVACTCNLVNLASHVASIEHHKSLPTHLAFFCVGFRGIRTPLRVCPTSNEDIVE